MQNKFSLPTQDEIVKRLKKIPEGLWRECSNCHEKFYYRRAGVYEVCPNCGSPVVIKKGRWGEFKACSNYPKCKTIIK